MKILSVEQIRELDAYTIAQEPISSLDLMERAARAFVESFIKKFNTHQPIKIFCGLGNNGGDGLAIARLLHRLGYDLQVYVIRYSDKVSDDFEFNYALLRQIIPIFEIFSFEQSFQLSSTDVVIDALLGSGLSRSPEGLLGEIITKINAAETTVVSVDIASGLFADQANTAHATIIRPNFTISFQLPKLAFLLAQNAPYVGEWEVVNIKLNQDFIQKAPTQFYYTFDVQHLLKPRLKYAHKGTFGHALLVVGSYGMMGAAILSARACLRAGVGKLTVKVPKCGYEIMQISIPEALILTDENFEYSTQNIDYQNYNSIGIGSGIGKNAGTAEMLKNFLKNNQQPLVIDADALNIIAESSSSSENLLNYLPKNTILTPHPKEFERLTQQTGERPNDFEKLNILRNFSQKYGVIVCLKGANTAVALPTGEIYFNSTGNAGMAKVGTGDVLTGIITAYLAQGYSPKDAAILGVFLHGQAGDTVAQKRNLSSILASDLIEAL